MTERTPATATRSTTSPALTSGVGLVARGGPIKDIHVGGVHVRPRSGAVDVDPEAGGAEPVGQDRADA